MACADLFESDSFFQNEMESEAEQTITHANCWTNCGNRAGWQISSTDLMTFQIGHADKSGERRDIDDGFDPLHGPSRREHWLRSGIASLSGRDGCRPRIHSDPRLVWTCGGGHRDRIRLGFLNSLVGRSIQRPSPALAGIPHQSCARGSIEDAFGQSFGPGGLLLKILRGHRCTSSAQAEANACIPSICLSDLRLCE